MPTWHYAGEWKTEGANEIILIDVLVHDLESNQRQVWVTDDKVENFIPKWVESWEVEGNGDDKKSVYKNRYVVEWSSKKGCPLRDSIRISILIRTPCTGPRCKAKCTKLSTEIRP